ncbi:cyclic nucleotide-binding domain-containing protein [Olivibacter jilunii]|uniref:cyclic nucleotide-binding domain-containing protein n=1 Tax=Olivibacter jilunii TaxID=985016 RepID=UPI00102F97E0|nr:cyclic nucleotide-binding domain-containing protein [Olivibacter jilunii]
MKKILVIGDNKSKNLRNIIKAQNLSESGVYYTESVKDGVDLALQDPPDIIVFNSVITRLDGKDPLHILQEDERLKNVQLFFLKSYIEWYDIQKDMFPGTNDCLSKSIEPVERLNFIETKIGENDIRQRYDQFLNGDPPITNDLTDKDCIINLIKYSNTNKYTKGESIYSEGNRPIYVFFIIKGKVKTFKRNGDGKELILGIFGNGDFLGHGAMIQDNAYNESAEALEDTMIAIIAKSEFEKLVCNNLPVMKMFIRILAKEADLQKQQLVAIAYNSLRKKVAEALLNLKHEYHNTEKTPYVEISRANLACIIGIAKESLIRTLSDFKHEKLITIQDKKILISDIRRLECMRN